MAKRTRHTPGITAAPECTSQQHEHGFHELVAVDLDPVVVVGVELSKRSLEVLDEHAHAREAVEGDAGRRTVGTSYSRGFTNIYPDTGRLMSKYLL